MVDIYKIKKLIESSDADDREVGRVLIQHDIENVYKTVLDKLKDPRRKRKLLNKYKHGNGSITPDCLEIFVGKL